MKHKRTCADTMTADRLRYERYKQDRRRAAAASHGDAWTGMCAAVPPAAETERRVRAEIARWERAKVEAALISWGSKA